MMRSQRRSPVSARLRGGEVIINGSDSSSGNNSPCSMSENNCIGNGTGTINGSRFLDSFPQNLPYRSTRRKLPRIQLRALLFFKGLSFFRVTRFSHIALFLVCCIILVNQIQWHQHRLISALPVEGSFANANEAFPLMLRSSTQPRSLLTHRYTVSEPALSAIAVKNTKTSLASTFSFEHSSQTEIACNVLTADDIVSFTLVTQCSQERLWMMEHHCSRWGRDHSYSLAVYSNFSYETIRKDLDEFKCPGPELLTLQVFPSLHEQDYPVNWLRNMALSKVQTTHVLYIDVDFWPSVDLYHNLVESPEVTSKLKESYQNALVLPAFQLKRQCKDDKDCREENLNLMPKDKEGLLELLLNRSASAFDPTNIGGHGSTRYEDWIDQDDYDDDDSISNVEKRKEALVNRKQSQSKLLPIRCIKSNRYEPYLVFRYCRDLPPFQEAFTGYGKNKMTWVMHLRRVGYQFWQLGSSFLTHYPHLDSKSRLAWNGGPQGKLISKPHAHATALLKYKRARNDKTFLEFRTWLDHNVQDQARMPLCDDAVDDDVRLWVDPKELHRVKRLERRH